jgi:hypothetical protein
MVSIPGTMSVTDVGLFIIKQSRGNTAFYRETMLPDGFNQAAYELLRPVQGHQTVDDVVNAAAWAHLKANVFVQNEGGGRSMTWVTQGTMLEIVDRDDEDIGLWLTHQAITTAAGTDFCRDTMIPDGFNLTLYQSLNPGKGQAKVSTNKNIAVWTYIKEHIFPPGPPVVIGQLNMCWINTKIKYDVRNWPDTQCGQWLAHQLQTKGGSRFCKLTMIPEGFHIATYKALNLGMGPSSGKRPAK